MFYPLSLLGDICYTLSDISYNISDAARQSLYCMQPPRRQFNPYSESVFPGYSHHCCCGCSSSSSSYDYNWDSENSAYDNDGRLKYTGFGAYDPFDPNANNVDKSGDAGKAKPKDNNDNAVSIYDKNGQYNPPAYYQNILSKVNKNEPLTPSERKIKESIEKLYRQYSPYQLDSNGNYILVNGQKKMSALGNEIMNICNMSNGWGNNIAKISQKIRSMSPEQLAALEHYFPQIAPNGKTLREVIKDSSSVWGFRWMNANYDSANKLFDYMDDKISMINPSNMARALYQALNNHRIGGLGTDDTRIVKLLQKMKGNSKFIEAVKEEYQNTGGAVSLEVDINDKWGVSSAVKQQMLALING